MKGSFGLSGFAMAAWIPWVPFVKPRLNIRDSTLGLLLSIGAGSTLSMPLTGFGCSNLVPIMFSAAGTQTEMPANLAITSVTTLGYAGILAGSALIGFIAQLSSLSVALSCIAALLLLVTASARRDPITKEMRHHHAK